MPVGRFPSQASGQPPELVRDLKRGRASKGGIDAGGHGVEIAVGKKALG